MNKQHVQKTPKLKNGKGKNEGKNFEGIFF
jgi:hypothetical protein